jgi:hypothetical protein
MKIYFAHSSSINYNEIYNAILDSEELLQHDFILPHKVNFNGIHSYEIIPKCDLFIAEVSAASTGMGIEIGRAEAVKVPMLLVAKSGVEISSSFDFLQQKPEIIIYSNVDDMVEKISKYLYDNFDV